jgi:dethiobiotin synthetase
MFVAKNIFIAATGQNCGKTITSIGLMHLAQKKYRRVGFIKPLGPEPAMYHRCTVDKDAALIAQVFELERDLRWMSPVVVHPDTTRTGRFPHRNSRNGSCVRTPNWKKV